MARRTAEERQRRRFARRQWARRWRVWRVIAVGLVLAGVLGGAGWMVYGSDTLSVQGAEVTGAATVGEDDVLAAAEVPVGGPLATVDLVAIQRRVAALASIRSVTVTRRWPHDVLIQVEERVPVAVVDRGTELRAVDADGVVFGHYDQAPGDLPRIEVADVADPDALREAAAVAALLPDDVAAVVDHLELRTVDDIDLELSDRRLVRWGSAEGSAEKAEVLRVLLTQRARVYDVSVPGQPTLSS